MLFAAVKLAESEMFRWTVSFLQLVFCVLQVQEICCNETPTLKFFGLADLGGLPLSPYTTSVEKAVAQQMGKMADLLKPSFVMALGMLKFPSV